VDVEFLIVYISTWTAKTPLCPCTRNYGKSSLVLSATHGAGVGTQRIYCRTNPEEVICQWANMIGAGRGSSGRYSIEDLQICSCRRWTFFYAHLASSCLMICAGTHGLHYNYGWKTRLDETSAPGTSCRVVGNICCSRKNKSASLPLRFDASTRRSEYNEYVYSSANSTGVTASRWCKYYQ
jgi:hypothetical protein